MIPQTNARGRPRDGGPPYVYADTSIVTSRSGKTSQLLVVRCPFCGPDVAHQHRAKVTFDFGLRTSPCGSPYVVVSGVLGVIRDVVA